MRDCKRILVVEDDKSIRQLIKAAFQEASHLIIEAECGLDGLVMAQKATPDLIILDLGLPDIDGFEFLAQLREWNKSPVIILSARGEEDAKVKALDSGASDYVTKPFSVKELLARVRAAIRLSTSSSEELQYLKAQNVSIDFLTLEVKKNGLAIHLTPTELKLLLVLARKAGRVVTHKQLLTEVWGYKEVGQNHYLRIFMKRLRNILEDDPTCPKLLLTDSGIGYRLQIE